MISFWVLDASRITIGIEHIKNAENNCRFLLKPNSLQISDIVDMHIIRLNHWTKLEKISELDNICVCKMINSLNGEKRFCLKLFVSKKLTPLF